MPNQNSSIRLRRARARVLASIVVLAAAFVIPLASAPPVSAQTSSAYVCNIKDFINPDGTIDTTGYLVGCGLTPQIGISPDCPTAEISISAEADPAVLTVGATTHVTAHGFAPDSSVDIVLCSTPVVIGSGTVDAAGEVAFDVTIPAGTTLGAHTIAVIGARSTGVSQVAYAPITVVSSGGGLPVTGSDPSRLIAIGAALVVLGIAALTGARRTRRQRAG